MNLEPYPDISWVLVLTQIYCPCPRSFSREAKTKSSNLSARA